MFFLFLVEIFVERFAVHFFEEFSDFSNKYDV